MSGILSFAGGVPLGLSIAALTVAFNYRTADWMTDWRRARKSEDKDFKRATEVRRHAYLLGLGSIGVASSIVTRQNPFLLIKASPILTQGVTNLSQAAIGSVGLSWGGAATVVSAVCDEWEDYSDGAKAGITGASLVGLLATSLFL